MGVVFEDTRDFVGLERFHPFSPAAHILFDYTQNQFWSLARRGHCIRDLNLAQRPHNNAPVPRSPRSVFARWSTGGTGD